MDLTRYSYRFLSISRNILQFLACGQIILLNAPSRKSYLLLLRHFCWRRLGWTLFSLNFWCPLTRGICTFFFTASGLQRTLQTPKYMFFREKVYGLTLLKLAPKNKFCHEKVHHVHGLALAVEMLPPKFTFYRYKKASKFCQWKCWGFCTFFSGEF